MRLALQAAMAAPDVRADKVLATRQRIARGSFRVMPAIVAWAMVNARV
jgi:anti-sigma28 factor (negative regulator of flagellin synthesis)